jgi:catechol 2,3-dioxygenase-like lactoylglutathione lyase family enzyme
VAPKGERPSPKERKAEGVRILRMDHAALLVRDVEASRRFYGGVLGMEEVARPSNFDFPGAWFRRGTAELHLIGEAEPGRAEQVQPGYGPEELSVGYCAHLALEVEDFEEARRQTEDGGARIVGAPRDRGDGVLQMYLADPDGYVVELMAAARNGAEEPTTESGTSGESAQGGRT